MPFYVTAPGPVENLITESISSHSWTFSWNQPTSYDCPAENYSVEYELLNSDQCYGSTNSTTRFSTNVTDTRITFTNLLPFSTYRVSVYSKNEIGKGPEVTIEDVTGESGKFSWLL